MTSGRKGFLQIARRRRIGGPVDAALTRGTTASEEQTETKRSRGMPQDRTAARAVVPDVGTSVGLSTIVSGIVSTSASFCAP